MIPMEELSAAFAFPPRVRVASRSEAGIEAVNPLSILIAYDCSLKNELPAASNDGAVYRDETVLARRRAATHPFHNANQSRIEMGIAESVGANERRPLFGSRVLENRGQFLGED